MDVKTKIRALQDTKNLLLNEGWCQGSYVNGAGHYCIYGALRSCTSYSWESAEELAKDLSYNLTKAPVKFDSDSLINWNDERTRRKRDVIRLIDRTIRNLETELD